MTKNEKNYQKCMKLARWCLEMSFKKKPDFYYKWYNRWLKLSDQYIGG